MYKTVLYAIAIFAHLSLFAVISQGEALERQMWEDIKAKNWNAVELRLAPYYQTAEFDGARDLSQTLDQLKSLDVNDFAISNIKVTTGPDVFIVTYDISVSETFNESRISSNAPRISVWQNNQGIWQWVAHAVLIPTDEAAH